MSLETWLVGKLEDVCPRVYRKRLPQSVTVPALTYQRISTVRGYELSADDELPTSRMQVDVWTRGADDADDLVASLVSTLSGYSDADVHRVEVEDDREWDDLVGATHDLDRRIVELLITYRFMEG